MTSLTGQTAITTGGGRGIKSGEHKTKQGEHRDIH